MMNDAILAEVFDTLIDFEIVDSEAEFSRDWLGRSESYARGLRFHKTLPSIASIAICASKLQHYGRRLAAHGGHERMAERFLELSNACHAQINARCEATWLAALEKGPASAQTRAQV